VHGTTIFRLTLRGATSFNGWNGYAARVDGAPNASKEIAARLWDGLRLMGLLRSIGKGFLCVEHTPRLGDENDLHGRGLCQ
jgi:hypothetical protein